MVIGGLAIRASLPEGIESIEETIMEFTSIAPKPVAEDKQEPSPMFSGDKRIPERFAECKRVPKIPNASGGVPRHYAVLTGDDSVKPLLIEMLGELMRLQKRAVDDKNAKARRRLVMGLREVARGIRSHKTKMVVMANNLDEYGIIDDKLQQILDLCREEGVPVFFEFNKRSLGHAIGKSIKVAVIG
jgi:selenocysteine insertion sequence-binding protein 2